MSYRSSIVDVWSFVVAPLVRPILNQLSFRRPSALRASEQFCGALVKSDVAI